MLIYWKKEQWFRCVAIMTIFCLWTLAGKAQTCDNLQGQWQNDLGSILQIDSLGTNGMIHGKYLSASGVDGRTFALMGWVNHPEGHDPAISFSVHWGDYGSITSWTGFCNIVDDAPQIVTMWHLVRTKSDFDWERVITNSSTFRPFKANDD